LNAVAHLGKDRLDLAVEVDADVRKVARGDKTQSVGATKNVRELVLKTGDDDGVLGCLNVFPFSASNKRAVARVEIAATFVALTCFIGSVPANVLDPKKSSPSFMSLVNSIAERSS
jgi:hypothetical protein